MTRKTDRKLPARAAAKASAAAAEAAAQAAVSRPTRGLLSAVAAFVVVFSAAGYAVFGNHDGWNVAPGDTAPAVQADAGHDRAQFEAMAARLAERLRTQPDDADGWSILARTYMVLEKFADAVPAYKRVAELRPDDADTYADWADAQAMLNGRRLAGEPERLVQQALKVDPDHLKALALAGTIAFERNDYAAALAHWERAQRRAGPDSEMGQRLEGAIADARQRSGIVAPAPGPKPAAAPPAAGAVSGEVTLADALKQGASPDDTVYVFARANDGSKIPLALVRKRVRDLPLRFTLDDAVAMNPAVPLSSAKTVVVGARVTKSGNAMPQPGDLQGFSGPVKVGQANVRIEIGETVR
jgi:cytochrome c-type biogenesis protein CcmH